MFGNRGPALTKIICERIHRRRSGAESIQDRPASRIGNRAKDVSVGKSAVHSSNLSLTSQTLESRVR